MKDFIMVGAGEGRVVALGESRFIFKVESAQTGGAYSIIEYLAPPGAGSPWHTHHHEDEAFYVLEGTLTFQLGDQRFDATPGSYVQIPRGLRHNFANQGETAVRALIIATPGGLEQYFADISDLIAQGAASPTAVEEINQRYGLAFE